jgi:DNA-binding XRE family transcriptional regulator
VPKIWLRQWKFYPALLKQWVKLFNSRAWYSRHWCGRQLNISIVKCLGFRSFATTRVAEGLEMSKFSLYFSCRCTCISLDINHNTIVNNNKGKYNTLWPIAFQEAKLQRRHGKLLVRSFARSYTHTALWPKFDACNWKCMLEIMGETVYIYAIAVGVRQWSISTVRNVWVFRHLATIGPFRLSIVII